MKEYQVAICTVIACIIIIFVVTAIQAAFLLAIASALTPDMSPVEVLRL